jgi:UDP-glucose 4-epimerase
VTILVIGGAGYIGAHVVRMLENRGDDVVVVDDLSTGTRQRVGKAPFELIDVARESAVPEFERVIAEYEVDSAIHFAAKKRVGESVERPTWYVEQNIGGLAHVLSALETTGVDRLVFSSSAAVYGMPDVVTVTEEASTAPINPYGRTKLVGEWMIGDASRAWGLRGVNLRYFNVAGAGWRDLGDPEALNLITIVFDRMQRGEQPVVFGDDYPTPDGTCIRDYVHVLDLARAHMAALDYLENPERPYDTFNVGTGVGASVTEVIDQISVASGHPLTPVIAARRPGDPPQLIADPRRILNALGWRPEHTLPQIVDSAWRAHVATMGERAG